jgi:hypothetical protein
MLVLARNSLLVHILVSSIILITSIILKEMAEYMLLKIILSRVAMVAGTPVILLS